MMISGGMNRDLILKFIDVQTRLIEPICPHFAEYVWRRVLKKEGSVVTAGWPVTSNEPDLVLKRENKYFQDLIISMRKQLQNQLLGSKKAAKKGAQVTIVSEKKLKGLIYVNEEFDGWKAHCLGILQRKFDQKISTYPPDEEIRAELEKIWQKNGQEGNFKQILEICMPFVKSKKDEVISSLGIQALDLKLPFGEIEVLESNKDLIKQQLGLEDVEICCATDPFEVANSAYASRLQQNSPYPGSPAVFFVTREFK